MAGAFQTDCSQVKAFVEGNYHTIRENRQNSPFVFAISAKISICLLHI